MTEVRRSLQSAMDAVMNAPYVPHQHVVSPRAMERKGWARCADCFGPVWLGDPTAASTDAREADPRERLAAAIEDADLPMGSSADEALALAARIVRNRP